MGYLWNLIVWVFRFGIALLPPIHYCLNLRKAREDAGHMGKRRNEITHRIGKNLAQLFTK